MANHDVFGGEDLGENVLCCGVGHAPSIPQPYGLQGVKPKFPLKNPLAGVSFYLSKACCTSYSEYFGSIFINLTICRKSSCCAFLFAKLVKAVLISACFG